MKAVGENKNIRLHETQVQNLTWLLKVLPNVKNGISLLQTFPVLEDKGLIRLYASMIHDSW